MKSLGPYFNFYYDDFIGGVQAMSASQIGSYILLLCEQWRAGFIPENDAELMRLSRAKHRIQLDAVLAKFERCADGKLRNPRMDAIRCERIAFIAKQSSNAIARWDKRNDATALPPHMPPHMPNGMPNACPPSPSSSPTDKTHTHTAVDLSGKLHADQYRQTAATLPADIEKPISYEAWFSLFHARGLQPAAVITELVALLSTEPANKFHQHGAAAVIGWKLDDIAKRHRRESAPIQGQSRTAPAWARKKSAEESIASIVEQRRRHPDLANDEQAAEIKRLRGIIAEANREMTHAGNN